ncbi:MAG: DNA-directed RNA polymerase subunit omega [candidate division Zixibacteria bacterium RBG_16_40_9]|nr:MAG: DNA-directed RNA polymerase subunit omega [candidate division Zixibacteria bacterium RBG_16_40_9]
MLEAIDNLAKQNLNRYEAVIITAKRARKLNEKLRKQQEQQSLFDETPVKNGSPRITSMALKELAEGALKFEKPQTGD